MALPGDHITPNWEWVTEYTEAERVARARARRRFEAACAAMQGLILKGWKGPVHVAAEAVDHADALIARLDERKK